MVASSSSQVLFVEHPQRARYIIRRKKPTLGSGLRRPALLLELSHLRSLSITAPVPLTSLLLFEIGRPTPTSDICSSCSLCLEHSCSRFPCMPSAPTRHGSNCVSSVRMSLNILLNGASTLLPAPLWTLLLSASIPTRM